MKLEQSESRVSQQQLEFFIKGSVSLEKSTRPCPARWITSQVRNNMPTSLFICIDLQCQLLLHYLARQLIGKWDSLVTALSQLFHRKDKLNSNDEFLCLSQVFHPVKMFLPCLDLNPRPSLMLTEPFTGNCSYHSAWSVVYIY